LSQVKIGRNDPCPCNSGNKYKYCCISKKLKKRLIKEKNIIPSCNNNDFSFDMTDDILNKLASDAIPIKNFCKDNDFYYFSILKVTDHIKFKENLSNNTLKKSDLINAYKKSMTEEIVSSLIADAYDLHDCFNKRRKILEDTIKAHYSNLYTLSIPNFFSLIEGLLRDYGGLELKDKFKSTIPRNFWGDNLLFYMEDDVTYFNAFIQKLYRGSQPNEAFNRNPILHGMNVDYYSEEWSLILLLIILEIRLFIWHEKNVPKLFNINSNE
jgi:hypothetical protein